MVHLAHSKVGAAISAACSGVVAAAAEDFEISRIAFAAAVALDDFAVVVVAAWLGGAAVVGAAIATAGAAGLGAGSAQSLRPNGRPQPAFRSLAAAGEFSPTAKEEEKMFLSEMK